MTVNPPFETDNRGKRSVALNLESEEAREIAFRLIEGADVFVTNMRPRALDQFGLSYEELSRRYPRLVYCQVTGYGPDGPDRNRAAGLQTSHKCNISDASRGVIRFPVDVYCY